MVKIHTNHGVISLQLDRERAPETVGNFLRYAKDGFYDGTIFHRVINGFMIQGGGYEPGMVPKVTREPIRNEADNGLSNLTGAVAMARTPDPHSATAQFSINVSDNTFLDHRAATPDGWGYCVFAWVVDGMDVVNEIKALPTTRRNGHADVPKEDVIIERVEIIPDIVAEGDG